MNIRELPRYFTVVTNIYSNKGLRPKDATSLRKIIGLIVKMWKLSGITFTIKYWSEVLRLVVCSIDMRNKFLKDSKIWVKTHTSKRGPNFSNFYGIPVLLPTKVKLQIAKVKRGLATGQLSSRDLLFFKLLLTCLSFFRATSPFYSEVSSKTITGKFTGQYLTLNQWKMTRVLNTMTRKRGKDLFKSSPRIFSNLLKAGPNSTIAVLGIGLDLVGWIMVPEKWHKYCLMCYTRGYFLLLTVFVLCSVLVSPVAMCYYLGNKFWDIDIPLRGRIAVLPEARGKRRKIGITDWWTQVLFRPLHDDIYTLLGTIPNDGTNDQSLPIRNLLDSLGIDRSVSTGGKRLQSMDLSAATDRLPVLLQSHVLDILGYEGGLWMDLLDREWYFEGTYIKYSVGQPMGAYSSFACLALTHHVITRYASLECKVDPKTLLYAILGDDGAMANKKVAKAYADIFRNLGMEINPLKGFDGTVLEFAKQLWTISGYNLSPLGAKNILLFMRNVEFLPSILHELLVKEFPLFAFGTDTKLLPKRQGFRALKQKLTWDQKVENPVTPLIDFISLEKLIARLFFNPKKVHILDNALTNPLRYLRIRLRVLMAIGPRSGLWSPNVILYSQLFSSFYDGFWCRQFITALQEWKLTKLSPLDLMKWIKNTDELRNQIITDLVKNINRIGELVLEFLRIPFTYLPIENSNSTRFSHFSNRIAWILVVFSPTIPILMNSLIELLTKTILNATLLSKMKILRKLDEWSREGILSVSLFTTFFVVLATRDFLIITVWVLLCVASHYILTFEGTTRWLSWAQFTSRGWTYWKAYSPIDSSVTTLEKVVDKVKLEDSGAFKQIIRMLRGNSQIKRYLINRKESEKKLSPVKKQVLGKRSRKLTFAKTTEEKDGNPITR